MNSELQANRIKNTTRNTIYGFINIVLSAVASFALRNTMVQYLGVNYLGLNSFYQSVVETIGTAELGIGLTMVFFLYEPVAKDDYEKINAYTLYLKKAYYWIGCIIITIGLCITPFLRCLMSSDIPSDINIYFTFIMYLLSVALSYFLFPELVFLAMAYQRDDYIQKIRLFTDSIMWAIQLIGVIAFRSYYIYIVAQVARALEVGALRVVYEKQKFYWIKPLGNLSRKEKTEIKSKVISMVGHQLDTRLLNGMDSVIIAFYLGLSSVGIYGNYYLILSTVMLFVGCVFTAVTPSIANAIITEKIESNYVRYRSLLWLNSMIAGWGTICLLCLYQDFMAAWMGKEYLYSCVTVILFGIYFYISVSRKTTIVFKNAMGMWESDKYKPYVSLLSDIVVDFVLIPVIGASGAILASIISEGLIEFPWENKTLFSLYFKGKASKSFRNLGLYLFTNVISLFVIYKLCDYIGYSGYVGVFLKGALCTLIFCAMNWVIYRNSNEYKIWKGTFFQLVRQ